MRRSSAPESVEKKAAPQGGGFFGAIKRKLSELGGGGPRGPRRIKATARRVGNTLIITIVTTENFSWAPPAQATVKFDAGTATAMVNDALTTRAGVINTGLTITLALELADDGRTPRLVEYMNAFETIELELQ